MSEDSAGKTPKNLAKQTYLRHIKEPEEINKKLLEESRTDTVVTNLPNDKAFFDMLEGLQDRWKRDYKRGIHNKGSFIVMDLVGLHPANDKFGREAGGNDYLRAVADTIRSVARGEDRFFRLGNRADEFVLYAPNTVSEKNLNTVMDRLDIELKENEVKAQEEYPGIKFQLSYSASAFGRTYPPMTAFLTASNLMGKAKESKNGERVGDVGRLFDNTYNV